MTTTCPKCGYVRRPEDSAPDYECPKCGVIYEKYLRLHAENGTSEIANTNSAKNDDKRSSANELVSNLHDKWNQITQVRSSKLFMVFAALACISIISLIWLFGSDSGNLRLRYWGYLNAIEELNFDKSYAYLSSDTRDAIPIDTWREDRKKVPLSANKREF